MTDPSTDVGVLTVLADRLVEQRLPKALAIKERVDGGALLDDADIDFLEQVITDARKIMPIVARNPQYMGVAGRMMGLYEEITAKALENEQSGQDTP